MANSEKALGRFSSPARVCDDPHGRRYREQVLATARALLGAAGLVAVYLDPTEPAHFARLAYLVYSISVLVVLRATDRGRPERFAGWLHGADIAWAAAISLFTSGPNSP